jgi:hypothetical protein
MRFSFKVFTQLRCYYNGKNDISNIFFKKTTGKQKLKRKKAVGQKKVKDRERGFCHIWGGNPMSERPRL